MINFDKFRQKYDWVVAVLENKAEDEVYEMLWQGMTDTQRENFAFLAC